MWRKRPAASRRPWRPGAPRCWRPGPSTERGAMFYVCAFARHSAAVAAVAAQFAHFAQFAAPGCALLIQCCAIVASRQFKFASRMASKPPLPRHLPGIKATPACRVIRIIRIIRSSAELAALQLSGRIANVPAWAGFTTWELVRGSNVVRNLHLEAPLSAALPNGADTLITADCYSVAAADAALAAALMAYYTSA